MPGLSITGAPRDPLTEGDQLELVCSAEESSESPVFVWIINGVPLTRSNSRIEIETTSTETEGLYTATSTLNIRSTLPGEDTGIYVCRVDINIPEVPSLSRSVEVTVQGT